MLQKILPCTTELLFTILNIFQHMLFYYFHSDFGSHNMTVL